MSELLSGGSNPPTEEAEKWHPTQAGEALVGRVEGVIEREVSWGRCHVAYVRARAGKLWTVFLSRRMLVDEWKEKRPHNGQRVAIIYDGSRESDGRFYHVYDLEVEGERPLDASYPASSPSVG